MWCIPVSPAVSDVETGEAQVHSCAAELVQGFGQLRPRLQKKRSKQDVMLTGGLEALGASPCTWCMTLAWEAGTGRAVTSHSSLAWLTY